MAKQISLYELRTKLLKATEANLKISRLIYENDIVNYIDVLDAQLNNTNAQQDHSSAVNSLQKTRVHVYISLGVGWDASAFSVRTYRKNRMEAIR